MTDSSNQVADLIEQLQKLKDALRSVHRQSVAIEKQASKINKPAITDQQRLFYQERYRSYHQLKINSEHFESLVRDLLEVLAENISSDVPAYDEEAYPLRYAPWYRVKEVTVTIPTEPIGRIQTLLDVLDSQRERRQRYIGRDGDPD